MKIRFLCAVTGLIVVNLLISCSNSEQVAPNQGKPTTGLPSASVEVVDSNNDSNASAILLVREAITNTIGADSLHFQVRESIPELRISPTEGDYIHPDKARGVSHSDDGEPYHWIKWGDYYFVRESDSGTYRLGGTETPAGVFLKFDLLADIAPYIDSATLVSDEEIDDASTTLITVIYDMQALPDLAFMSSTGKGRMDVWISKDTKYIHKLGFSAWNIDAPPSFSYYSDFNVPVTPPIEMPSLRPPAQPSQPTTVTAPK